MIRAAGYDESCTEISMFVTSRLKEVIHCVLAEFDISSLILTEEDLDRLTSNEIDYRREYGRSMFVPESISVKEKTIKFWLKNSFLELYGLLFNEKVETPSLRCEYLIVSVLKYYIDDMDTDEQDLVTEIPDYLESAVESFAEEVLEGAEEEEQGLSGIEEARKIASVTFADIRCWIGHPKAPEYYGQELLLDDDDYSFLDDYDEGSLYYSDTLTGLGVFQWRNV